MYQRQAGSSCSARHGRLVRPTAVWVPAAAPRSCMPANRMAGGRWFKYALYPLIRRWTSYDDPPTVGLPHSDSVQWSDRRANSGQLPRECPVKKSDSHVISMWSADPLTRGVRGPTLPSRKPRPRRPPTPECGGGRTGSRPAQVRRFSAKTSSVSKAVGVRVRKEGGVVSLILSRSACRATSFLDPA